MAYPTIRSASADMSLGAVAEYLGLRPDVDGIAALGSTGRGALSATSDIDLLVVLGPDAAPSHAITFEVVYTFIADRPADVIITTTAELQRLFAADWHVPLPTDDEALLRWIRNGKILLDRSGALAAIVARYDDPVPWTDREQWSTWWEVNFALAKAVRYSGSGDFRYRRTARWVLHGYVHPALRAYFAARHIAWAGEREAFAYLEEADPGFLATLESFFDAVSDQERVRVFARIVRDALDPIGGLWPEGTGPVSERWEQLLSHKDAEEA